MKMTINFRALVVLSLAVLAAGMAGCASKSKAAPHWLKTAKVSGVVTCSGLPLEDAVVTFQSAAGSPSAFGRTGSNGRYQLTTYQSHDGAVPGEYRVSIVKVAPTVETSVPEDDPNYGMPPARQSSTQPVKPTYLVAEKYTQPATSGLLATVPDDGAEISFDLQ